METAIASGAHTLGPDIDVAQWGPGWERIIFKTCGFKEVP